MKAIYESPSTRVFVITMAKNVLLDNSYTITGTPAPSADNLLDPGDATITW